MTKSVSSTGADRETATAPQSPTRIVHCGKSIDLVTSDVNGSGASGAEAFRESYLLAIARNYGTFGMKEVECHFKEHPLTDPVTFAKEMSKKIILGIYLDFDGTISDKRGGYNDKVLFSPDFEVAARNALEKTGLLTIASAAHSKRMLMLIDKAKTQVPLDRMLFFAENGLTAMVPVRAGNGYTVESYTAVMPKSVETSNCMVREALDKLSEMALKNGLFMFPNQDKMGKVTLELMGNGKEANQKILDRLVLPYIKTHFEKELRLHVQTEEKAKGSRLLKLPALDYTVAVTGNSVEFDHLYLPSKITVSTIMNQLTRRLLLSEGPKFAQLDGEKVFLGFGDSPYSSDFGLVNRQFGNVGFVVDPKSQRLDGSERLADLIGKDQDASLVGLPPFTKDCGMLLGNGEATAYHLNRALWSGTFLRVKDLDSMRSTLMEVLGEMRYVPTSKNACEQQEGMYTLPAYLSSRKDSDKLVETFLSGGGGLEIEAAEQRITAIAEVASLIRR